MDARPKQIASAKPVVVFFCDIINSISLVKWLRSRSEQIWANSIPETALRILITWGGLHSFATSTFHDFNCSLQVLAKWPAGSPLPILQSEVTCSYVTSHMDPYGRCTGSGPLNAARSSAQAQVDVLGICMGHEERPSTSLQCTSGTGMGNPHLVCSTFGLKTLESSLRMWKLWLEERKCCT